MRLLEAHQTNRRRRGNHSEINLRLEVEGDVLTAFDRIVSLVGSGWSESGQRRMALRRLVDEARRRRGQRVPRCGGRASDHSRRQQVQAKERLSPLPRAVKGNKRHASDRGTEVDGRQAAHQAINKYASAVTITQ
jgi:hypothetical protein